LIVVRMRRSEQAQNGINRGARASGRGQPALRSSHFRNDSGEPRRNRTFNPQIKSLLLCQLS
jgi:hypothetical protein